MASEQRADAQEPSFLDEPWLRRQVETHLVFGWFARRLDFGWLLVSVPLLAVVLALNEPWGILLAKIVLAGIFVVFFFFRLILRMPRYRQAAFGWCITKATLAVRSFLFLLGSLVAFERALRDRGREVQLIVVSGAGHVFNFRRPQEARRAWDASLDWLRKHVSPT